jgi:diaminopimelate epimerase
MTERIPVTKYHGTGNDFVVVDAATPVPDRRAFARTHCDRESGIVGQGSDRVGADGVLFCAVEDRYDPPRIVMTIVQPDGSTAAMCGNGARCAAHWAMERTGADAVMLDTLAGTRRAVRTAHGVRVEMGAPGFEPAVLPLDCDEPLIEVPAADLVDEAAAAGHAVTAVNTGVPHAVVLVGDAATVPLGRVGPALRHADAFPEGANVTVASPRDDGGFDARTYERGIEGETAACGTGAVAVAVVAERLGRLDGDAVEIRPPGGDLGVALPAEGPPTLRGPVVREYETRAEPPAVRPVGATHGTAATDD